MALSGGSEYIDYGLQQLHAVAYGEGDMAHWALFVPSKAGDPRGVLIHVGVEGGHSGKGAGSLIDNQYTILSRSIIVKRVIALPDTRATLNQVKEAARKCYDGFKYNIALANCQTFSIDVLEELHRRHPSQISTTGIETLKQRGTTSTAIHDFLNANPQNQATSDGERTDSGDRFSID